MKTFTPETRLNFSAAEDKHLERPLSLMLSGAHWQISTPGVLCCAALRESENIPGRLLFRSGHFLSDLARDLLGLKECVKAQSFFQMLTWNTRVLFSCRLTDKRPTLFMTVYKPCHQDRNMQLALGGRRSTPSPGQNSWRRMGWLYVLISSTWVCAICFGMMEHD